MADQSAIRGTGLAYSDGYTFINFETTIVAFGTQVQGHFSGLPSPTSHPPSLPSSCTHIDLLREPYWCT